MRTTPKAYSRSCIDGPCPSISGLQDLTLLHWKPSEQQLARPDHGGTIRVGKLEIRCLATPGHTTGGICYRVEMPWGPVSFVGDTLFAGSIGRSNPAQLYHTHLESVQRHVMTLPPDCLLLPGHGPGTTVQEELEHNPFYTHAVAQNAVGRPNGPSDGRAQAFRWNGRRPDTVRRSSVREISLMP